MTPLHLTWHHIRRSPFQSLTAISVILLTFLFGTFFALITNGMDNVLGYFESKPEITIFLKDGLDKATIESVQTELASYTGVKEIKYISKDKALELYRTQNKDNPMLLEMVTASVLPASFEVSVNNPKILGDIADNFQTKTTVVDEIIYQKDIIQSLLSWTDTVRKVGLVIISSLSLIAFMLIFAIIGMKITNRKEEVRISRVLGASRFYVKKPFLLEGLFYGIFGSTLGFAVASGLAFYKIEAINNFFQPVVFLSSDPLSYVRLFLIELGLGAFMGLTASWFGVKRYIKY